MISGGRDTRRKKEVGELKSTGIVRPVDNLGRIVLPIELRRVLDIDKDAALEVYVDNDSIVLKKYQPAPKASRSIRAGTSAAHAARRSRPLNKRRGVPAAGAASNAFRLFSV